MTRRAFPRSVHAAPSDGRWGRLSAPRGVGARSWFVLGALIVVAPGTVTAQTRTNASAKGAPKAPSSAPAKPAPKDTRSAPRPPAPPPKGRKPRLEDLIPSCTATDGKCHLRGGIELFRAGFYTEARLELDQAYALLRSSGALRLLAECYRLEQRFVEAYVTYERVLTQHANQLSAKEQQDIRVMLGVLDLLTAQLEIHIDEPDAEITVDGHAIGKSPLKSPVRVSVGKHRLRATLAAFPPVEQEIDVQKQQKLAVVMRFVPELAQSKVEARELKVAGFSLRVTPDSAIVLVDGKQVSRGNFEGQLPFGKHRIEAVAPGHRSYLEDILFEEGRPVRRDVALAAVDVKVAEAEAPAPVTTRGWYGRVLVDGAAQVAGQTFIPCPDNGRCSRTLAMGGGAALRGGYKWDHWAVEASGGFLGDGFMERHDIRGTLDVDDPTFAEGNVTRLESFSRYSFGGNFGVGGRYVFGGEASRFTVGVIPGLTYRRAALRRTTSGGIQDAYFAAAQYIAFALTLDAGVEFGSMPGGRFYLGLSTWLELAPRAATPSGDPRIVPATTGKDVIDVALSTPAYVLAQGPQFWVGPTVGFVFGQ